MNNKWTAREQFTLISLYDRWREGKFRSIYKATRAFQAVHPDRTLEAIRRAFYRLRADYNVQDLEELEVDVDVSGIRIDC